MTIKNGGKTEPLTKYVYINSISVQYDASRVGSSRNLILNINDEPKSTSYLELEEALALRDELNEAIKRATGL